MKNVYGEYVERWKRVAEERFSKVEQALLKTGFRCSGVKGSHWVFRHELVTKYRRMWPDLFGKTVSLNGALVIPRHGNQVQKFYLSRIVRVLEVLGEIQALEDSLANEGYAA